jgi:hypothetical protein
MVLSGIVSVQAGVGIAAGTRATGRSADGVIKCLAGPVQHRLVPVAAD